MLKIKDELINMPFQMQMPADLPLINNFEYFVDQINRSTTLFK